MPSLTAMTAMTSGGDRVGPRPAEQAVEQQPDQQHRRQVGAQQGLLGVGDRRQRAEFAAGAALRPGQDRHDDQADGGQHDPDGGVLRFADPEQRPDRVDGDVGGQAEERERDDPQRDLLARLRGRVPANCQATAAAEDTSMTESRPNPISAVDEARVPAVIATTASITL